MRRALTRAVAVGALISALVVTGVTGLLVWPQARQRAITAGWQQATAIAAVVTATADSNRLRSAIARTPAGAGGRLAVHLGGNRVIGSSHADEAQVRAARRGTTTAIDRDDGLLQLLPVEEAVVEVFSPAEVLEEGALETLLLACALAAAGVLISVFTSVALTRPVINAVRGVGAQASAIARGALDRRVRRPEPAGLTELAELAAAINAIAEQAVHAVAHERDMVADLSHRLRTPLTALRLDAEAAGDGPPAERIRKAVTALECDVDDIIRSTRPDELPPPADCDVAMVLRKRMAFWSVLTEHQRRRCRLSCTSEPARIGLAEEELAAVIDALIGNVLRHTAPGTGLAVTVVRHAGWITLAVEDGGAGIRDVEQALRRGASGGGSTGLGLDITRHAVESSGGTIHIDRGRLGGARVRLRFAELGADQLDPAPLAWRLWHPRT